MDLVPTPHNSARLGDFADTVLMPGDPLRAKFIADHYLDDVQLVNNVRNIQGYTGYYKGKRVSVMASGMGMPSIGIYAHELFNFYGVKQIIRVGSAGAVRKELNIGDIIIVDRAKYTSNFPRDYLASLVYKAKPDKELLERAVKVAEELKINYRVGKVYSSDIFYKDEKYAKMYSKHVLAVEMESAALYAVAHKAGKKALTICTISDNIITGEALSAEKRQKKFRDMMVLALELA